MLKVALVQQRCSADVAANQAESESQIRRAAGEGAQLVVLQELHSGLYFCQTEDTGQFDLAEPLDGPSRHRFEDLARELDIVLVISLFEKRATGLYHNTALVMDADRGCAGYYRKMHIPDDPGFYEKFYFHARRCRRGTGRLHPDCHPGGQAGRTGMLGSVVPGGGPADGPRRG